MSNRHIEINSLQPCVACEWKPNLLCDGFAPPSSAVKPYSSFRVDRGPCQERSTDKNAVSLRAAQMSVESQAASDSAAARRRKRRRRLLTIHDRSHLVLRRRQRCTHEVADDRFGRIGFAGGRRRGATTLRALSRPLPSRHRPSPVSSRAILPVFGRCSTHQRQAR